LQSVGIPCGPIYRIDQVFEDEQVTHLGMAAPVDHPNFGRTHYVGPPLNMGGLSKPVLRPAPIDGLDTVEVLKSVGYEDEELARLRSSGIV